VLRVFIDFADHDEDKTIGIQDCVVVTKALDEPLDQNAEIDALFKGAYELEVSSPGVDRPLRTENDFQRFSGRDVRLHVFRPLNAEEIENEKYQTKNPKQKNFIGQLKGIRGGKVLLAVHPSGSALNTGKAVAKKKASSPATNSVEEILIPLPLISKANLEPQFDFDRPAQDLTDLGGDI
jgi:ribosome maturation factor RimP